MPPGEAPRNWNVVARSVDVPMVVWYGPLLIGQICDSSGSSLGHCDRHEQRGGRNQIRKPQKHKGGLAHLSRLRSSPRTEVEMRRFMAESMDRALTPVPYCTALYKSLHDPTSPMDGSMPSRLPIWDRLLGGRSGLWRRSPPVSSLPVKGMIRLLVASGPLWWGRSERAIVVRFDPDVEHVPPVRHALVLVRAAATRLEHLPAVRGLDDAGRGRDCGSRRLWIAP